MLESITNCDKAWQIINTPEVYAPGHTQSRSATINKRRNMSPYLVGELQERQRVEGVAESGDVGDATHCGLGHLFTGHHHAAGQGVELRVARLA